MEITRFYETMVAGCEGKLALRFCAIPASALQQCIPDYTSDFHQVAAFFRLDMRSSSMLALPDPVASYLPHAFIVLLETHQGRIAPFQELIRLRDLIYHMYLISSVSPDLLEFTSYAAYREVIPFEFSPLHLHSLADIISSANPRQVSATVGFLPDSQHGPVLLLSLPVGVILCSAADHPERYVQSWFNRQR